MVMLSINKPLMLDQGSNDYNNAPSVLQIATLRYAAVFDENSEALAR
jgi:hypothetical protein